MATTILTYKNGNNFENEAAAAAVTVTALVNPESARGTVAAEFVTAGETYQSLSVPANCIVKNFYLVVEEAMTGTVQVILDASTPADIFAAGASVTTVGATISSLKDVYVTTPTSISFIFSATQTAGVVKVAYDLIYLDTNTAKYVTE